MKIKTYVMTVSRYFPSTHPRKGQETHFVGKVCRILQDYLEEKHGRHAILDAKSQYSLERWWNLDPKIHTIRSNYVLWEKRIKEVLEGKAILSLRYWEGKPYNSKQIEFAILDEDSWIGIQKVYMCDNSIEEVCEYCEGSGTLMIAKLYPSGHTEVEETCDYCEGCGYSYVKVSDEQFAKNDGLSLENFKAWFKGYDLSKPMAIIHFTSFRY